MSVPLPDSFRRETVQVGDVRINTLVGGDGPPVLLLHGYPQTHLIWHGVAPALAEQHTVVLTDLRGYGDSDKPAGGPGHEGYSKRTMARDQVLVMRELGFERFAVAGHDRGGRVAHRMALDHPDAVRGLAVLDIVPTHYAFRHADMHFALGYYHWFLLAADDGVPERLIGGAPEFCVRSRIDAWSGDAGLLEPAAVDEYVRCFSDPAAIHASCEDYRAAASVDLEHDEADRANRVIAPLLALWGAEGFVGATYDVLSVWRGYADNVGGAALPSGHYVPEEAPQETADALLTFFGSL
ncbi:MAG: alpha/beta hydrolase [Saccharopolyspora sp.]|uniref:alpha/beta fold hydrolase n=1 Tax=Saccharopolyspora sp. TaxID=33915 RepID=UPI0025E7189B|nr:alpha/beta hydrolase [Saccharopolyspora sp.]MBQ6641359.1 alpha/beta hydrolase [Saccharopolyspora sp.]